MKVMLNKLRHNYSNNKCNPLLIHNNKPVFLVRRRNKISNNSYKANKCRYNNNNNNNNQYYNHQFNPLKIIIYHLLLLRFLLK